MRRFEKLIARRTWKASCWRCCDKVSTCRRRVEGPLARRRPTFEVGPLWRSLW